MNRTAYRRLVRTLMNQHGLTDWKIEWNRAKRTHGVCSEWRRTLIFSEVAFDHIGEAEIRDTVLHEVAHALVGNRQDHNHVWRAKCLEIGGTGRQYVTREASAAIPAAWEGTCPLCGNVSKLHRAPLRVKSCGKHGGFRPEAILSWKQHGRRVPLGGMPVRYAQEALRMRRTYGDRAVNL